MSKHSDNRRRTLSHLARLKHEGQELIEVRPLDDLAQAKWIERVVNYIERKMPDVEIPPLHQLGDVELPDALELSRHRPHPLDAAMSRSHSGTSIIRKLLVILASAQERLELQTESDQT